MSSAVYFLSILKERFQVVRMAPGSEFPPAWAQGHELVALVRTANEISVVCASETELPPKAQAVDGWRALQLAGQLDFSQVGVLATLAVPLAQAGISIFVISTFDTDYILVQEAQLEQAVSALQLAGHQVENRMAA